MAADGAVQSVRRALGLLGCFGGGDASLGLSDLARRAGLSTSTTHRLARTLTGAGFLEQEPSTGRYRLGPSITELGQLSFHRRGLHRIAPELAELAKITSATVDLAVRNDRHAVILSGGSLNPDSGAGLRRPLHSTALGKVLLAWDPEAGAGLAALGPLRALTGRTIVDHDELRAELGRVRECGYALNDEESGDGVRTVAVPVLDRQNHVRYALAVRSTPQVIADARIGWFVAHARSCARALEILLIPPAERRLHPPA
ncbi:IclR family transcriptional regulator [Bailinhaonella thermotolerans]|uniref:Glycerol operon regulatory protein n=1 Tax=Bailinhaonella thermotolerans TaxID=1070861 RepID=A0A3A4B346_9ACTN|nr:IclR family transcriptional regulator [Bailinhaonella thermotolerans]RJL35581.1 IclR family transcriptional regulator [Bailinhaonella thermotolerans]